MLWALRCEGLTADERDDLTDRWWAPARPDPADASDVDDPDGVAGAADDEWAQEWAHRMGLT